MEVIVRRLWDKIPERFVSINTTSGSSNWSKGLSPFLIGPINYNGLVCENFENFWQYQKCYKTHLNDDGSIKDEYFLWRKKGFENKRAVRYPMGKGAKPEFLLFNEERLGYIEARKKVYIPFYQNLVKNSEAFEKLKILSEVKDICLLDYDAYDHTGMSKDAIINNEKRKMGHAFCLMWLLKNE